jgi:hypothetical protein
MTCEDERMKENDMMDERIENGLKDERCGNDGGEELSIKMSGGRYRLDWKAMTKEQRRSVIMMLVGVMLTVTVPFTILLLV